MCPTFTVFGDWSVVDSYSWKLLKIKPQVGDVVVFRKPTEADRLVMKRVIGVVRFLSMRTQLFFRRMTLSVKMPQRVISGYYRSPRDMYG